MARGIDTWLVSLPQEECEELLRTAEMGRLGVIVDGRPAVFPVGHVYVDGTIAFPTNGSTKMHAALSWPFVAYEVDGIEADGLSAWSVMVSARAEEIIDPDEQRRLASLRVLRWRTSPALRWIRLLPIEMTGRRIIGETPSDEAATP